MGGWIERWMNITKLILTGVITFKFRLRPHQKLLHQIVCIENLAFQSLHRLEMIRPILTTPLIHYTYTLVIHGLMYFSNWLLPGRAVLSGNTQVSGVRCIPISGTMFEGECGLEFSQTSAKVLHKKCEHLVPTLKIWCQWKRCYN